MDSLPAIVGLASKIEHVTGSRYSYGVFMDDLSGLCWSEPEKASRGKEIVPSWSWASFQGPISMPFAIDEPILSGEDAKFIRLGSNRLASQLTIEAQFKPIKWFSSISFGNLLFDDKGECFGKFICQQLNERCNGRKPIALRICERQFVSKKFYKHRSGCIEGLSYYDAKIHAFHINALKGGGRKPQCSRDWHCDCSGAVVESAVYFLIVVPSRSQEAYERIGLGIAYGAAKCNNERNRNPFARSQRDMFSLV
jgi:hypothetical protein